MDEKRKTKPGEQGFDSDVRRWKARMEQGPTSHNAQYTSNAPQREHQQPEACLLESLGTFGVCVPLVHRRLPGAEGR